MSYIDIGLVFFLIVGAIMGYKEGFLMEVVALVAIILGVLSGFKLMGQAMILLEQKWNINEHVLPYVAFGVVFVIVVVLVTLLGRALKAKVDKSFLGRVDQAAGAALGFFRTAFMVSVILWLVHSLNYSFPEKWTANAWLYPKLSELAPTVTEWISSYIPLFEDVF
ncbi:MAG: CvpA family protein [Cyclobacteriaceae bacterium]|nr:CvpA family protein [Flammeovirgaceae bacterium]MCZ8021073.1 CvpA family protein [Cytophagales bacterium]MCZ8328556.1 CvpA family protein [Cyclobacteriaceae bacterium]